MRWISIMITCSSELMVLLGIGCGGKFDTGVPLKP
jgi:hypothetical protein